jgi:hypothetical protein
MMQLHNNFRPLTLQLADAHDSFVAGTARRGCMRRRRGRGCMRRRRGRGCCAASRRSTSSPGRHRLVF